MQRARPPKRSAPAGCVARGMALKCWRAAGVARAAGQARARACAARAAGAPGQRAGPVQRGRACGQRAGTICGHCQLPDGQQVPCGASLSTLPKPTVRGSRPSAPSHARRTATEASSLSACAHGQRVQRAEACGRRERPRTGGRTLPAQAPSGLGRDARRMASARSGPARSRRTGARRRARAQRRGRRGQPRPVDQQLDQPAVDGERGPGCCAARARRAAGQP